jgi:hypothetical protein
MLRKSTRRGSAAMKKIGEHSNCSLCGGNGLLSEPCKGRPDVICPCCNGDGLVPFRPFCRQVECLGLARCNRCYGCSYHCTCFEIGGES